MARKSPAKGKAGPKAKAKTKAQPEKEGRPPRLMDTAMKRRLLQEMRKGVPRETAAVLAGLGKRTLFTYLAKGKRKGPEFELYRQFRQEVLRAEAEAEANLLTMLRGHASNFLEASAAVKAATWLLERRYPKRYGRRDHLTHANDKDAPVVFTLDVGELPGAKNPEEGGE